MSIKCRGYGYYIQSTVRTDVTGEKTALCMFCGKRVEINQKKNRLRYHKEAGRKPSPNS